jgi:hypothetical protein
MITYQLVIEAAAAANVPVPPDTDEEKGAWALLQAAKSLGERRLESALRDARDAEGPGMASRGEEAICLLRRTWSSFLPA